MKFIIKRAKHGLNFTFILEYGVSLSTIYYEEEDRFKEHLVKISSFEQFTEVK